MKRLQQLPGIEPYRIATGPARFGSDWPGIFIRGDDALSYANSLRTVLKFSERSLKKPGRFLDGRDHAALMELNELRRLLNTVNLNKRKRRKKQHPTTPTVHSPNSVQ